MEEFIVDSLADSDVAVSNYILNYNPAETGPQAYFSSFNLLASWIDQSLDLYKVNMIFFSFFLSFFFFFKKNTLFLIVNIFFWKKKIEWIKNYIISNFCTLLSGFDAKRFC